jgi:hypothetical protein
VTGDQRYSDDDTNSQAHRDLAIPFLLISVGLVAGSKFGSMVGGLTIVGSWLWAWLVAHLSFRFGWSDIFAKINLFLTLTVVLLAVIFWA